MSVLHLSGGYKIILSVDHSRYISIQQKSRGETKADMHSKYAAHAATCFTDASAVIVKS
jgi:hypothetical protein